MHNCESENYVAAEEVTYKLTDIIRMWSKIVFVLTTTIIISLIESIKSLINVFFPSENKIVKGQLALVTGGANGLGREIAKRLAIEGCNIAIVDLDFMNAEKTAKEIELEFNVKTKAFKVDVSSYEDVLKLRNDVEKSIGTVDILVNNAGILPMMSLEESRHQDIQRIINVNLTSHFWTCQIFLNGMIERKRGHILATCSVLGKFTYPMATVYCASKHGVDGFMNALFDELCVKDHDEYIKLTTAYPAFINTRKDLSDLLDKVGDVIPRLTPAYTADVMVKALLQNKRSIVIPTSAQLLRLVQLLPDRATKYSKLSITQIKDVMK